MVLAVQLFLRLLQFLPLKFACVISLYFHAAKREKRKRRRPKSRTTTNTSSPHSSLEMMPELKRLNGNVYHENDPTIVTENFDHTTSYRNNLVQSTVS